MIWLVKQAKLTKDPMPVSLLEIAGKLLYLPNFYVCSGDPNWSLSLYEKLIIHGPALKSLKYVLLSGIFKKSYPF